MRSFSTAAIAAAALATAALATAARAEPLVVDADTTLSAPHAGSIVVTADGVTLDCAGQPVLGDDTEDIGIDVQADDVTVVGCVVDRFAVAGISAVDVDRVRLQGVGASRSDIGVRIRGGSGHVIDGAYVTTGHIGVFVNDVRETTAAGVVADGIDGGGIRFWRTVDSELSDALVIGATGRGISMWDGYRSTLRDSRVQDCGDRGIYVGAMARSRVERNESHHNAHNGIGLHQSTQVTAEGNLSSANGGLGLNVSQSTCTHLVDNTTRNNGRAGFGQWLSPVLDGSGNVAEGEAVPFLLEGEPRAELGDLGL